MTAILGGDIQLTYVAVLSGLSHFKSGRLRPLAVASASRYPALPEVPTTAEAGLAGYEIDFWYALLGPGGMAPPLVERIQRDVATVLLAPEMRENLLAQGCIAVGGRPEELTALIKNEYALWSRVVQAGGVKVD
jgi:tripartite-type tricarboxylate transporter receptor subunit TctC